MQLGKFSGVFAAVFSIVLLSVAVGCGGNAESNKESNKKSDGQGGSGGNTAESASREQSDKGSGGGSTGTESGSSKEMKIALGDILSIDDEKRRLLLKPVQGERQIFRIMPNATVTVDDKLAELSELEKGQQVQLRYIIKKDLGRAREVSAFK